MRQQELERAARLWGDHERARYYAAGGLGWAELPAVQAHLNEKVSGDPHLGWIEHLLRSHLAGRIPVDRCLSLCCWQGRNERDLAGRGAFRHCLAYDISEQALERERG